MRRLARPVSGYDCKTVGAHLASAVGEVAHYGVAQQAALPCHDVARQFDAGGETLQRQIVARLKGEHRRAVVAGAFIGHDVGQKVAITARLVAAGANQRQEYRQNEGY